MEDLINIINSIASPPFISGAFGCSRQQTQTEMLIQQQQQQQLNALRQQREFYERHIGFEVISPKIKEREKRIFPKYLMFLGYNNWNEFNTYQKNKILFPFFNFQHKLLRNGI